MSVDAAGVVHEGNTALARLHAVAKAPIFSYDESFFGSEIVGGPLLSVLEGVVRQPPSLFASLGREGERYQGAAHRICSAEVRLERNAALGHQREPSPSGERDLFREPTAWEKYRWQMLTIGVVLLFSDCTQSAF